MLVSNPHPWTIVLAILTDELTEFSQDLFFLHERGSKMGIYM